jgi:sec-independent protein translocase protein TatA
MGSTRHRDDVLCGAKKLPDAARSLGKSMRIFKAELGELHNEGKTDAGCASID